MKKTTQTSSKKTSRPSKRVPKSSPDDLVAQKLDSVLETSPIPEPELKLNSANQKKGKSFPWPAFSAITLIIIFIGLLVYEYNADFKMGVNNLLGFKTSSSSGTSQPSTSKEEVKTAEIPLTIVYNSQNPEQKAVIERYIQNLEKNLANTKVNASWLDKEDPKAKEYLEKTGRKYLPLLLTNEKIKEHPRYNDFASAVQEKNGLYFFQSEGMEYLEIPPIGEARYAGVAPDKAKVVIMEYASLTCHYCQEMAPILTEVLKAYPKEVSIVYKHYDRGGPDSLLGQAVECAGDQKKLAEMENAMFASQAALFESLQKNTDYNKVAMDFINEKAKAIGLNVTTLNQCLSSKKYESRIAADTEEATSYGVSGTPSFFVNKKFIGGAVPLETLKQTIDSELNPAQQ